MTEAHLDEGWLLDRIMGHGARGGERQCGGAPRELSACALHDSVCL